jgi:hypothetical protein
VREWLSKLVGARALSKADREVLKAGLAKQFEYLRGFVDALPGMSDAQVAARAALYAGAVKSSYWNAWADESLPCVPGGCEECYGSCRCDLTRESDGIHWHCRDDHASCGACKERGATWQPYRSS